MINCKICLKDLKSEKSFVQHIRFHLVTSKEYFDTYLKQNENEGICECGKETKFKGLIRGYNKYCSTKCSNNSPERKEKFRRSYLKNDMDKVKEKRMKTFEENNSFKSIQENNKNTFGVNNCLEVNEIKLKAKKTKRSNFLIYLDKELNDKNLILKDEYTGPHNYLKFECSLCHIEFTTKWNYIQQGKRCPGCFPEGFPRSQYEDELINFLSDHKIIVEKNIKSIIHPKELDIFLPEHKIAIEINGLYWHSKLDEMYHFDKFKECLEKEIHLIQIFDDEWIHKKDVVKNFIKNKVLKPNEKDVCIKSINRCEANHFLFENSLEGMVEYFDLSFGMFDGTDLVSVLVGVIQNNILEIKRFCSIRSENDIFKYINCIEQNYRFRYIKIKTNNRLDDVRLFLDNDFYLESLDKPICQKIFRNGRIRYRDVFIEGHNIEIKSKQTEDLKIWNCGYHSLKKTLNCG